MYVYLNDLLNPPSSVTMAVQTCLMPLCCFSQSNDCILVLTVSTGNMTQCSATPAVAPAIIDTDSGVESGRLS